jgi:hypothetical protein
LSASKEIVERIETGITLGFQGTEQKGEIGRTLLIGLKDAPSDIGEIDFATAEESGGFEDDSIVLSDICSRNKMETEVVENLGFHTMENLIGASGQMSHEKVEGNRSRMT